MIHDLNDLFSPIQMCKDLVALLFGGFRSLDAPYFRCVVVSSTGDVHFGSHTIRTGLVLAVVEEEKEEEDEVGRSSSRTRPGIACLGIEEEL